MLVLHILKQNDHQAQESSVCLNGTTVYQSNDQMLGSAVEVFRKM